VLDDRGRRLAEGVGQADGGVEIDYVVVRELFALQLLQRLAAKLRRLVRVLAVA
jgi:hypothetical protein